jgi:ergothioneine biosynthesis protein EgtB
MAIDSPAQPMSVPATQHPDGAAGSSLAAAYRAVRHLTEALCAPLETDDYLIQSMPEASPVKWHLAHTTWFFETFVLAPCVTGYRPFHPAFGVLFNSYYNAVGPRWPRSQRGLLSRPSVAEVYDYRAHVDEWMAKWLAAPGRDALADSATVLGMQHEQQHQELILTDLKHALAANPLHPVYQAAAVADGPPPPLDWVAFPKGERGIGHEGRGFAFDNETPRHRVLLNTFQLASRPVTNEEYLAFMVDGGYARPEFWLADGWAARQAQGWTAPLYWEEGDGLWSMMTLAGLRPLQPAEPVCHICYYEADAFARWAGARLPTETEWETAAAAVPVAGHFLESGHFQPAAAAAACERGPLYKLYGDVWQWTASPYIGYPGYRPLPGALGEYNGKFMCNQFVLRGASCATPRGHVRLTYRNFFPPEARWQFSGFRLARDQA